MTETKSTNAADLVVPMEPSVKFLDKHINDVHPKFKQLQPTYSGEDGKFIEPHAQALAPIEETLKMQRQQNLFLQAVAKFEKSSKGVKSTIRLSSSSVHTWEDVITELHNVENAYEQVKSEGPLGRTRHCLRQMKKLRRPCEQWMQVCLPSRSKNVRCTDVIICSFCRRNRGKAP